MLTWIKDNSDFIKICFVLVAGIWTLTLYYCSIQNRRIEKTLSYSEQYNKGNVFKFRVELNRFWLQKEQLELLNKYRNKKMKVEEIQEEALKAIRCNNFENNIYVLHSFYLEIIECARRLTCDKETACKLYKSRIRNFRDLYMDFLYKWGDAWGINACKPLTDFIFECDKKYPEPIKKDQEREKI